MVSLYIPNSTTFWRWINFLTSFASNLSNTIFKKNSKKFQTSDLESLKKVGATCKEVWTWVGWEKNDISNISGLWMWGVGIIFWFSRWDNGCLVKVVVIFEVKKKKKKKLTKTKTGLITRTNNREGHIHFLFKL